jgi:hypothetical protein
LRCVPARPRLAGMTSLSTRFIGRRAIFTFGNSDGDLQMLQWTAAGEGVRFAGLVHHTDAEREYAYDRQSKIGKVDKALNELAPLPFDGVDHRPRGAGGD